MPFFTHVLPGNYDPKATKSPSVEAWFKLCCSYGDHQKRGVITLWKNVFSITSFAPFLWFILGPAFSGKSTVTTFLPRLFGHNRAVVRNATDLINPFVLRQICKCKLLLFPDLGANLFANNTVNTILKNLTGSDLISVQTKNVQGRQTTRFEDIITVTSNHDLEYVDDDGLMRRVVPVKLGTRVADPVDNFETLVLDNLPGLLNYVQSLPSCEKEPLEVLSRSKEGNIFNSFATIWLEPDETAVVPIQTLVQMFKIFAYSVDDEVAEMRLTPRRLKANILRGIEDVGIFKTEKIYQTNFRGLRRVRFKKRKDVPLTIPELSGSGEKVMRELFRAMENDLERYRFKRERKQAAFGVPPWYDQYDFWISLSDSKALLEASESGSTIDLPAGL